MRKKIVLCFSAFFFTICATQQPSTSLDDLIKTIFNTTDEAQTSTNKPNIFQPIPTQPTNLNPSNPDKYKSCGVNKECVPRYLCSDQIITDGSTIIDIRVSQDCGYLEECCDVDKKNTKPPIITVPDEHAGCGYQNPNGVGFKIVGDENNESQFGEFPWMVAILREEEAGGDILNLYDCGGALIAPTVILTAAHCVQTRIASTLVVRAGEWDTQTKTEILPHQDRRVKEIIVHELYNKGSLFNDIGLLILDNPYDWAENVRPICLPQSNIQFDHSRCFATGWGKDKFGREGSYQVILKKIDLPVVPRDICQIQLRSTRLGKYFQLHNSFICAGGEKDKDTCKGDGGSPLVCPIAGTKNRFYQAGIVAWGIGCGEENIPGVYANIPYLREWLNQKLNSKGIDFSHFTP